MAFARFIILRVDPISISINGLSDVVSTLRVFIELFVNVVKFPISDTATFVFPEADIIYLVLLIIELST